MPNIAGAGQVIPAAKLNSLGLVGSIVSTGGTGVVTSGTTETVDSVLGVLTFTALAGRFYRVSLLGRALIATVAGDRFSIKFRYTIDGSTPTAGSTLVDHDTTYVAPGATGTGAESFVHMAVFAPGAATVKVMVTVTRLSGTGTGTTTGFCQFFAEAM